MEQGSPATFGRVRFRDVTGGIECAEDGEFSRVFDVPDGNGGFQFNRTAFSAGR